MITLKNIVILPSLCIIALTGCFSSTSVYKKEYKRNDSTFVHRDEGAQVYIRTNGSINYTGELLFVSDSETFMNKDSGLTDEELSKLTNQIDIIKNDSIKSIWVQGDDNHLIGLAIGIGVGIPLIIASGPKEGENFGDYEMAGLGLTSIVAGFLVGAATSTYDEEIYNNKNYKNFDFIQLNIYSRYGGEEPDFLKEIK